LGTVAGVLNYGRGFGNCGRVFEELYGRGFGNRGRAFWNYGRGFGNYNDRGF